ncbi:hypothetical protein CMV_011534 [Castanea mollissima]|uniref:Uncharacterized protein n=1 Tax=Castanea mollissima TaxID=60419 RepID=A0A8J4R338_9ROSI|nr:hypothetical protein CMV_011534 [Castanea mollissima]
MKVFLYCHLRIERGASSPINKLEGRAIETFVVQSCLGPVGCLSNTDVLLLVAQQNDGCSIMFLFLLFPHSFIRFQSKHLSLDTSVSA